jgi:putative holliday junction resolvase
MWQAMHKETAKPSSTTVLAFDFGESRIGVAVGDSTLGIAHPVTTLHVATNAERLAAVEKLFAEWQPHELVIGEPHYETPRMDADGNVLAHPIAHLAKKFGNRLKENFRVPVYYVNEFLSSHAASESLREQGVTGKAQKADLDAAAAQVILQSYFDERARIQTAKSITERKQDAA